MSDTPSKSFWTAVGALATVAGVLLSLLIWQENRDDADDPADAQSESASAARAGGDGAWYEADSYTVQLPTTFQGDDCWDRHFDLDEAGASERFHGDSGPADWADLIWYSCGDRQTGYLYSPTSASGTTAPGDSLDPGLCNAAAGGDASLDLVVNPDLPPTVYGCLVTTADALAGVSLTGLDWVGDGVEADLNVVLRQRDE